MLLRRITKHVQNQNWFAVFIDFLIVVFVGVFIGIQVSNWNETRAERGSESEYLLALEQDVTASLDEIESIKEISEEQDKARKVLYDFSLSDKENAKLRTHKNMAKYG